MSEAPRVLMDEAGFLGWLGQARADDALVYHRGFLAIDASSFSRRLSSAERLALGRVARRAWWAGEQGLVHLMQRRHGPEDFSYLAIARALPQGAGAIVSTLLKEAA